MQRSDNHLSTSTESLSCPIPQADARIGREVWQSLRRAYSPLAALRIMRDNLGDIFQVKLPGFHPIFLSGPKYSRFLLVDERDHFHWRTESDPVARLLRHGVLVEDGAFHDQLRASMNDILSGKFVNNHIDTFWQCTDAMERARSEVNAAFQGMTPTRQSLSQLPFLEMVIKESLRLFPPIHVGNRQAAVNIPIDNFTILAGEWVMYSIYLTQRDPNYWPGSDDFHPERFDRSSGIKPAAFSYLPFGGGPRTCIGAAFAQVEVKAILARLLSTVNLTLTDSDVQPHMGATLEPRPGVMMRIQHREPA